MACTKIRDWIVCHGRKYEVGEMPPKGYNDWFEWSEVQHKAGLRSVSCGVCGKCKWPQELSGKTIETKYRKTKHGPVFIAEKPVCRECQDRKGVR